MIEAVYYLPSHEEVPELMRQFVDIMRREQEVSGFEQVIEQIAKQHVEFERIHPFADGNGRVGRMIINQQLINNDFLPIAIDPTGKYRQAFQRYERNGDISIMVHLLCKGELEAVQRVQCLLEKSMKMKKEGQTEIKAPRL